MGLTGTFTNIRNASTLDTAADHATALEAATYKNIDQGDCQSDTGVVTAGAAAPSGSTEAGVTLPYAGVMWQDTNTLTNGPRERLKFYEGTNSEWIALAQAVYQSTEPSATAHKMPGMLWRDTTLHLWRRYESATTAPDGVAGWHPLSEGWQLWKNESGAIVPKGAVVIHDPAGAAERCFTTATIAKHQGVVGVTAETVSIGGYGVIATVSGGAQVDALITVASYGVAQKGEVIVVDPTAGYGRQAGPKTESLFDTSGANAIGMPRGAYAEVLSVATVTGLHPVRMLGAVGTGMYVMHAAVNVVDDTTPPTSTTGYSFSPVAIDSGHEPIFGAQGYLELDGSDSVYSAIQVDLKNAGDDATLLELRYASGNLSSNPEYAHTLPFPMVRTGLTTSATLPGNVIGLKYTANDGTPTFTQFKIFRTGYIC